MTPKLPIPDLPVSRECCQGHCRWCDTWRRKVDIPAKEQKP